MRLLASSVVRYASRPPPASRPTNAPAPSPRCLSLLLHSLPYARLRPHTISRALGLPGSKVVLTTRNASGVLMHTTLVREGTINLAEAFAAQVPLVRGAGSRLPMAPRRPALPRD